MANILYKSKRIGRHGKPFFMYKFRTLKEGSDSNMFTNGDTYTRFGKFLRMTKLDELPQLWNVLRGDLALVGPRAEEERTSQIIPQHLRDIILSVKPGITSPASIHFYDEEKTLQASKDPTGVYWTTVKPMKLLLDVWYVQHRGFLLDLSLIWTTLRTIVIGR